MLNQLSAAEVVGLAIVQLGVVFAVGWWLRRSVGFLRALFIPSSVVAGFLVLLGGEGAGQADRHGRAFPPAGRRRLGLLVVLFLLGPVFGLPPEAGSLLEMSFAGGHGTIAGATSSSTRSPTSASRRATSRPASPWRIWPIRSG